MMDMIRNFYREKSASELYHDLGKLCQKPQETATDFLVRAFELRQKVSATAKIEGNLYEGKLINDTFCRSLRTGLSNDNIRLHMKQFLDPAAKKPTPDDVLLYEINVASSESEETSSKLKTMTTKKVTINEATGTQNETSKQDVASAIKPLLEGMASLQKQVKELQDASQQPPLHRYQGRPIYRCKSCKDKDVPRCMHCFHCGGENHLARNCPTKNE